MNLTRLVLLVAVLAVSLALCRQAGVLAAELAAMRRSIDGAAESGRRLEKQLKALRGD